jgi:hypothetical protein
MKKYVVYGEEGKGQVLWVNFVGLLRLYIKTFAHTDVLAALHYLYLIQDENIRYVFLQFL